MSIAAAACLHDGLLWQASSELEEVEIREYMGEGTTVFVAPDLVDYTQGELQTHTRPAKAPAHADILFLSRIAPKKNLLFCLEVLSQMRGSIHFTIAGPADDQHYWERVRARIGQMPAHIQIEYLGAVPPTIARGLVESAHFLFLPTLGENFGHVIFEALSRGVPPLISDLTPWRGLASAGAGWDLPLASTDAWVSQLQACVDMGQLEYDRLSHGAREAASSWLRNNDLAAATALALDAAARHGSGRRAGKPPCA